MSVLDIARPVDSNEDGQEEGSTIPSISVILVNPPEAIHKPWIWSIYLLKPPLAFLPVSTISAQMVEIWHSPNMRNTFFKP